MKKNLMKILAAFAVVLGLGFAMNCATVNAATKIYTPVPIDEVKTVKVGNYNFTPVRDDSDAGIGYEGLKVTALDGTTVYTFGSNTSDFFTNGTNVYFAIDYCSIYKLSLTNMQLTKVKKYKADINICQVYGNNVYYYYYPGSSTERVVMKYINSNSHKTKTVSRNIDSTYIKAKGRYLYYKMDSGKYAGKKFRRDCKTGKTKRV